MLDFGQEGSVGAAHVELDAGRVLGDRLEAEQPDPWAPRVGTEGCCETVAVGRQSVDRLEGSAAAREVLLEHDLPPGGERLADDLVCQRAGLDGGPNPHELLASVAYAHGERVDSAFVEADAARLVAGLPERDEEAFDTAVRDSLGHVFSDAKHIRGAADEGRRDACRLGWSAPAAGERGGDVGDRRDVVLGLAGILRGDAPVELLDVAVA